MFNLEHKCTHLKTGEMNDFDKCICHLHHLITIITIIRKLRPNNIYNVIFRVIYLFILCKIVVNMGSLLIRF